MPKGALQLPRQFLESKVWIKSSPNSQKHFCSKRVQLTEVNNAYPPLHGLPVHVAVCTVQ